MKLKDKPMPGLTLISGNRLELLAGRCASRFREAPLPPMTREIIVLQSMGMMQWLSIRLAGELGIWADFEYVLPNRMTGILMRTFFPGLGDERFFEKDIMTWKTMRILRDSKGASEYGKLHDYMKDDTTGIREYQLASRITDLFDQYMTFRPDMILRWDRGEFEGEEEWQPLLWRELVSGMGNEHPPALLHRIFSGIENGAVSIPENLPRRISVFGISYLPLYHLNVLRAASVFCDVHLYMLNPCMEYWVDIMKEKEITSMVMKKPIVAENFEEDLHIERGNPLLASMGRAGRDFFRFLYRSDAGGEDQIFDEPGSDTVLHIIQSDILTMTGRGDRRGESRVAISDSRAAGDPSVVINSCHSIMREIEVLHDYLLDLFNNDRTMTPGDVLVMTPDIEECSSIIQGVFDRREEGLPRIPYRIVDRRLGSTSRTVEAFLKILSLPGGRFTSAEVMSILQCPDVLRRFALSGDDFDSISSWVKECGIYWGIDSAYKDGLGLPEIHENTWSFGIERMLLGSVMSCGDETPLGILPYSTIEGGRMQVLGRFITFFRRLRELYDELTADHSPDGWGVIINRVAVDFFDADEDSSADLLQIVKAAARLREISEISGFGGVTGLAPVMEFLESSISSSSAGRNFITGDLTFCEMLPMRSIPCRVICLIGMNEYSFPRKARPSGFDLMMSHPRMGDRSVRDEDRYLFLETVISARERLYISYTGQNITTNTDQNPSIVVSELMECIDETFMTESSKKLTEYIFRKQRIQPYHPVYFTTGSGYYSYSRSRRDGADSYIRRDAGEYVFFKEPLPGPGDDERTISADDLGRFLINPSKYLLKERLNISLEYYADDFKEVEPFSPDALERYSLEEMMLALFDKGMNENDIYARARAGGMLPHGNTGDVIFRESYKKISDIYSKVAPLLVNRSIEESVIQVSGISIRIKRPVYDGKFIFYRSGRLRAAERLAGWVCHLSACCAGKHPGFETVVAGSDEVIKFRFADNAREILGRLADIYSVGMTKPLPLFPSSSYEYASAVIEKDPGSAIESATAKFNGSFGFPDAGDPYIAKLFGSGYEPGEEFIELADKVYSPMIGHQESIA